MQHACLQTFFLPAFLTRFSLYKLLTASSLNSRGVFPPRLYRARTRSPPHGQWSTLCVCTAGSFLLPACHPFLQTDDCPCLCRHAVSVLFGRFCCVHEHCLPVPANITPYLPSYCARTYCACLPCSVPVPVVPKHTCHCTCQYCGSPYRFTTTTANSTHTVRFACRGLLLPHSFTCTTLPAVAVKRERVHHVCCARSCRTLPPPRSGCVG